MDDTVCSSGRVGSNPVEEIIIDPPTDLRVGALTKGAMLVSPRVVRLIGILERYRLET